MSGGVKPLSCFVLTVSTRTSISRIPTMPNGTVLIGYLTIPPCLRNPTESEPSDDENWQFTRGMWRYKNGQQSNHAPSAIDSTATGKPEKGSTSGTTLSAGVTSHYGTTEETSCPSATTATKNCTESDKTPSSVSIPAVHLHEHLAELYQEAAEIERRKDELLQQRNAIIYMLETYA